MRTFVTTTENVSHISMIFKRVGYARQKETLDEKSKSEETGFRKRIFAISHFLGDAIE